MEYFSVEKNHSFNNTPWPRPDITMKKYNIMIANPIEI